MNLVEARRATLGDRPFETLNEFEHNSELIYGTIIRLWMKTLDPNCLQNMNFNNKVIDKLITRVSHAVGTVTLLRFIFL